MPAPERRPASDRRTFHHDEPGALKMLHEATGALDYRNRQLFRQSSAIASKTEDAQSSKFPKIRRDPNS